MTATDGRPTLLDVNLLVALAWPTHVHHSRALRWWRRLALRARSWATCSATELGFVRVSSNRKVFATARSPGEAVELLRRIVELPGHQRWTDDVSILDRELVDLDRVVGHRQVADAHLVALALRHGGRIATFDRGLVDVVPANAEGRDLVEVVDDDR